MLVRHFHSSQTDCNIVEILPSAQGQGRNGSAILSVAVAILSIFHLDDALGWFVSELMHLAHTAFVSLLICRFRGDIASIAKLSSAKLPCRERFAGGYSVGRQKLEIQKFIDRGEVYTKNSS